MDGDSSRGPAKQRGACPRRTLAESICALASQGLLRLWLASELASGAVLYPAVLAGQVVICQPQADEDEVGNTHTDGDVDGDDDAIDATDQRAAICYSINGDNDVANSFRRSRASFAEWDGANCCGCRELCTHRKTRRSPADRSAAGLRLPPGARDPLRPVAGGGQRPTVVHRSNIQRRAQLFAHQIQTPQRRPVGGSVVSSTIPQTMVTGDITSATSRRALEVAVPVPAMASATVSSRTLPNLSSELSPANGNILFGVVISAAITLAAVVAVVVVWLVVKRMQKKEDLILARKGLSKPWNAFPSALKIGPQQEHPVNGTGAYFAKNVAQADLTNRSRLNSLQKISVQLPSASNGLRTPFGGSGMAYMHARTPSQTTGSSGASSARWVGREPVNKSPHQGYADSPPAAPSPSPSARPYPFRDRSPDGDSFFSDASSVTSAASFASSSSSFSASSFSGSGSVSHYANRSMPNLPLPSHRYHRLQRGAGGRYNPDLSRSAVSLRSVLSDVTMASSRSPSLRTYPSPPVTAADRVAMAGRNKVRMFLYGDDEDDRFIVDRKEVLLAATGAVSVGSGRDG